MFDKSLKIFFGGRQIRANIVNSIIATNTLTGQDKNRGFTLIELMIVVAIIAIILTLALPVYTNYTIRAKMGEALGVAASPKTAVTTTCQANRTLASLDNDAAGYSFTTSKYVSLVQVSGPCTNPLITITTQNTGTNPDPVITLTGTYEENTGHFDWTCGSTTAPDYLLPTECRST